MKKGSKPTRAELVEMLREIQRTHYHEPDSDLYEYCVGCGRSPYNKPPHTAGCIVPKLGELLRREDS